MGRIVNLQTQTPMEPTELFGMSAKRLMTACNKVMDYALRPYDGCYRAPNRPSVKDLYIERNMDENFGSQLKATMAKWREENPEEFAKEEASRKEWEFEREKQFRIIFGIAKRKGLYLKWYGEGSCVCMPDQWEVLKNGEPIARIYL